MSFQPIIPAKYGCFNMLSFATFLWTHLAQPPESHEALKPTVSRLQERLQGWAKGALTPLRPAGLGHGVVAGEGAPHSGSWLQGRVWGRFRRFQMLNWGHKKGFQLGGPGKLDEESSDNVFISVPVQTILRHPENDPTYTCQCVLTGFPKKRGTPQSSKTIFLYWIPWFCRSFILRNPLIWVFLILRTHLWDSESYCSPWPCNGGVPVDLG